MFVYYVFTGLNHGLDFLGRLPRYAKSFHKFINLYPKLCLTIQIYHKPCNYLTNNHGEFNYHFKDKTWAQQRWQKHVWNINDFNDGTK